MNSTNNLLYEPKSTDEYFELTRALPDEVPAKINLNAITFYAKLGMKPKSIGVLVGCAHTTIWANNKLRQAYENGAVYLELEARQLQYEMFKNARILPEDMLKRTVGSAEQDVLDGMNPQELQSTNSVKVTYEIQDTTGNPAIEALRKMLDDKVQEATDKNNE